MDPIPNMWLINVHDVISPLFYHGTTALLDQDLPIVEDSWWHSDAPHSCRTPPDEWSARRRDLYLTTRNNHKRQSSMPPAGFEPTNTASERPQYTPPTARPLGSDYPTSQRITPDSVFTLLVDCGLWTALRQVKSSPHSELSTQRDFMNFI